jgi:cytochrome P450
MSQQPSTVPPTCPVSSYAERFDPFVEPYVSDPFSYLKHARDEEPVFYSPEIQAYVATRYSDIRAVLQDTETFSPRNVLDPVTPFYPTTLANLVDKKIGTDPMLVNEDEPTHMQRRRRFLKYLLPEQVARLEPWIRGLVTEYLDGFVDRGEADIVKDLAWELPALVVFKLLGVPDSEIEDVKRFAVRRSVLLWGRPTEQEQNDLVDSMGEFYDYCRGHVERLRANLGDDMVSEAIRAEQEDPELFYEGYAYNLTFNFLFGGHESTTNGIANGIRALLEHPDQWRALCDDPSLVAKAVHELIRFAPSANEWRRLTTRDTQIGDVAIPEGSTVVIVLGSANYDETVFDNAGALDVCRKNAKSHLTFGVGRH